MGVPVFPPRFDTDHMKPFYAALAEGELRLTACAACGRWCWYPPEISPCHPEAGLEWRAVSGKGRVHTFTTVERSLLPGDHRAETPYTVLLVESDDVPGARIPSLFVNAGDREAECGLRVRLSPLRVGDYVLPAFEPAD
jgi:uncharacterized protein